MNHDGWFIRGSRRRGAGPGRSRLLAGPARHAGRGVGNVSLPARPSRGEPGGKKLRPADLGLLPGAAWRRLRRGTRCSIPCPPGPLQPPPPPTRTPFPGAHGVWACAAAPAPFWKTPPPPRHPLCSSRVPLPRVAGDLTASRPPPPRAHLRLCAGSHACFGGAGPIPRGACGPERAARGPGAARGGHPPTALASAVTRGGGGK